MTASLVFQLSNGWALLGWIILGAGIVFSRTTLRDEIAGKLWPIALSLLYFVLILFFFAKAQGGFDSLANVQRLFTHEWAALAGWVHYLAFDLLIGAYSARRLMEAGCSRWWLLLVLPLTFMFGPMGFLGFEVAKLLFQRRIPGKAKLS